MSSSSKSIGILGGSFDPVHNGHVAIAQSFIESGFITELWVLLTPDPPHKTEKALADYPLRLKMLEAAFSSFQQIKISDLELQLPQPSYTVQTLAHLTDRYPNYNFYLCLGEDSLQQFKTWKNWKQILGLCELLVTVRPSATQKNLDDILKDNVHFIPHTPVKLSSTMVRNWIREGKDISGLVPEPVQRIIKDERLYH